MDFIKAKILKKLERLPENAQQQVLDFVEFKNIVSVPPLNW
ncbi:MAG: hypothetical protein RMY28_024455 [Nostoc sp. ChiSLP01]|nr:hypothetical protein [Nostoc sp. CmiSLP01]MDZ8282587.1 hypothetical protein [Nostoc sp. ChiSLP01]